MKYLSIVIWMIGYPLILSLDDYIRISNNKEPEKNTKASATLWLIVWILGTLYLGYLFF
jgi:UDP-N-acetylmuramyl pentapeptide phosphotransferase/UDP-N-acetylglucosamine-1-phosphate transferase